MAGGGGVNKMFLRVLHKELTWSQREFFFLKGTKRFETHEQIKRYYIKEECNNLCKHLTYEYGATSKTTNSKVLLVLYISRYTHI